MLVSFSSKTRKHGLSGRINGSCIIHGLRMWRYLLFLIFTLVSKMLIYGMNIYCNL